MRSKMRWVMLVGILIGASLVCADMTAFAQCPPGTHWSNRYWQCVRDRVPPPPPPPPAYRPAPPPPAYRPAPPPPGRQGCKRSYQNCLMVCAGVPQCVNNCNVGYGVCRQQHGW